MKSGFMEVEEYMQYNTWFLVKDLLVLCDLGGLRTKHQHGGPSPYCFVIHLIFIWLTTNTVTFNILYILDLFQLAFIYCVHKGTVFKKSLLKYVSNMTQMWYLLHSVYSIVFWWPDFWLATKQTFEESAKCKVPKIGFCSSLL